MFEATLEYCITRPCCVFYTNKRTRDKPCSRDPIISNKKRYKLSDKFLLVASSSNNIILALKFCTITSAECRLVGEKHTTRAVGVLLYRSTKDSYLSIREVIKQPVRDTRVFPWLNQEFVIKQSRIPSLKELASIHDFCGTKLNGDTRPQTSSNAAWLRSLFFTCTRRTEDPDVCHT